MNPKGFMLSERTQFLKMTHCKCPFNDILKKKNPRARDQTSGCQVLGMKGSVCL